jgi:hypothetical protein
VSDGICGYNFMYINTVANSVMLQLYLGHAFYNTIFKIKYKLYIAAGSAPPPPPMKSSGCAPVPIPSLSLEDGKRESPKRSGSITYFDPPDVATATGVPLVETQLIGILFRNN